MAAQPQCQPRVFADRPGGARARWRWACVVALWAPAVGCGDDAHTETETLHATLCVVDEQGEALRGARVTSSERETKTDASGCVRLALKGPDTLRVDASHCLSEVALVGWQDRDEVVTVRLLGDADGKRISINFGGDVMFGRRYLTPNSGEPLLREGSVGADARAVVRRLGRGFSAADLSLVNLETVVSERGFDESYPGKRFLLESPPEALDGLQELGVDLVSLANNHVRDWLEPGLADTLSALDARRIPHVGAGVDAAAALEPAIVEARGLSVGALSFTSVEGSYVNDNYPEATESAPATVAAADQWMWQPRSWSYEGASWDVPLGDYRIGDVWQRFSAAEGGMSDEERADAWAAMSTTYPELQDWVARRGHGGAAYWSRTRAVSAIGELRPKVDLLVVQLHSGFQFQEASSAATVEAAHAAIDAGADIVIAHHPHVLQGLQWYRGKLVVFSLGNFVFDQDFLSTFASCYLHTVWEAGELVEARLLPVELSGYEPLPVTDLAARRIESRLLEASLLPARSSRQQGGVYPLRLQSPTGDGEGNVSFVPEWGTVRVTEALDPEPWSLQLAKGEVLHWDPTVTLVGAPAQAVASGEGLWLGRDLFGWGHFEDTLADGLDDAGTHFLFDNEDKQLISGGAPQGRRFVRLRRDEHNRSKLLLRPVARISLTKHFLYDAAPTGPQAMDGAASHELRWLQRGTGEPAGALRLDFYHFDDTNPTEDPSSEQLASVSLPLQNVGAHWRRASLSVDPEALTGRDDANMVMIYVTLSVPENGEATLDLDELQWVEWRQVSELPAGVPRAFTWLRNESAPRVVSLQRWGQEPKTVRVDE